MGVRSGQRPRLRKTAANDIYETLKMRIVAGHYPAGTRLRQDALAQDLGTSRIPVREALFLLEGDGLVEVQPYRGAVVRPLNAEEIRELFRLRAMLECDMLERAVPNMTDKDIAVADKALRAYDKAVDSGMNAAHWSDLNWQFHSALYRPANSPVTLKFCYTLHDNTDRYQRLQMNLKDAATQAHQEHDMILKKCREKDVAGATDMLKKHILHVGNMVADFIAKHHPS
ncbi:GntR family transcriptional regulator [Luteithermobacter gelatinilyticus]|uniref:GntR family transcriptional regulator n=1 Tax=Luteithermobacter gelatinilyticus TaxID=2582913 RepID=UPI001106443B|nr:GntR family transcriptional regulator [Luteithermobacter gelatinilyticus]|tara:strand:- start:605 stop:1288 length:684 start_codon:yes stop_codon:yes gene_type:complete